jgi:2-keto-4-pentenoate hydratase
MNVAAKLVEDHRARRRFAPFAAECGITTVAQAYAIQRDFVALRTGNAQVVGYKVGLTSPAMQAQCGLDAPVSGVITRANVLHGPATLVLADFMRLGIEIEIAVRLKCDVAPGDDVASAVEAIAPAMEIVDNRDCDYATLEGLSFIADNGWHEAIVLGPWLTQWPELAEVEGVLFADGYELARGTGSAALGHPFQSVAWLAENLARHGEHLRAGEIVMTGNLIKGQFADAPAAYRYDAKGLGTVACDAV